MKQPNALKTTCRCRTATHQQCRLTGSATALYSCVQVHVEEEFAD